MQSCGKLWTFERIPGSILIGNDTKTLPAMVTRDECQQRCLMESDFQCRSAKFRIYEKPKSEATLGECTLSDVDRRLLPNSYRVSGFDDEYFENQCVNGMGMTEDLDFFSRYFDILHY